MNKETNTPPRSSETLSRKQKLLRRAVPLALIAGGTSFAVAHELGSDEPEHSPTQGEVTVAAHATTQFGGEASGWGQKTAERALKEAVHMGAVQGFASFETFVDGVPTPADVSMEEIDEIVDNLPTYTQASQALEDAGYADIVPDNGDKLTVDVQVTVDTDKHVSYVVTGATIDDNLNNQE